jgi:hypothetical protein
VLDTCFLKASVLSDFQVKDYFLQLLQWSMVSIVLVLALDFLCFRNSHLV